MTAPIRAPRILRMEELGAWRPRPMVPSREWRFKALEEPPGDAAKTGGSGTDGASERSRNPRPRHRPRPRPLNLSTMNSSGNPPVGAPSSSYVMLISLVVALGGFPMGFDSGVIGGVVEPVREGFALNDASVGWVGLPDPRRDPGHGHRWPPGRPLRAPPDPHADRRPLHGLGRRQRVAPNADLLVIARVVGGFGVGGALLIAPMYIAEIMPPEQRGKLVSFNQLNIVLGFSASFFSNYFINGAISEDGAITNENAWRIMLGVETIPAALYLGLLFLVPPEPRWLASRGRTDEALAVLERTSGAGAAGEALRVIEESLAKAASASRARLGDLFNRRMVKVMAIGLGLGFFQQITGINAIFYYAPTIFEMSGADRDSALFQAIVVGLVNVGFTLIAMWLIDRAGRRPLLLVGTSLMAVALFTNAYSFQQATYTLAPEVAASLGESTQAALEGVTGQEFGDQRSFVWALEAAASPPPPEEGAALMGQAQDLAKKALSINGTLVLLAICLFIAGFAISLGPVMWAMFSEIFPLRVRGLAISVAGFFNSAISTWSSSSSRWGWAPTARRSCSRSSAPSRCSPSYSPSVVVPETKGRSLEELEAELVG